MKDYFTLDRVSYSYPDGTVALQNLSLTIPPNKKIAILGQNGSGKSTLFQLLMGLIEPTSGTIQFNEMQLKYKKAQLKQLRQQVGLIFQDANNQLFASTVEQDIQYGPIHLGWGSTKVHQQVNKAMQLTELTNLANRPIHFLSGGQKKRVSIAGVYAMDPSVIILDEPTSSLDYYFSKQLMSYLAQLEEQDRTFLYATHQINLVYGWADHYIVLHDGELLYEGNGDALFSDNELLEKAHIEKPWIIDMYEELNELILDNSSATPRTKEALVALMKQRMLLPSY